MFPLEGEHGLDRLPTINYRSCDQGLKVKSLVGVDAIAPLEDSILLCWWLPALSEKRSCQSHALVADWQSAKHYEMCHRCAAGDCLCRFKIFSSTKHELPGKCWTVVTAAISATSLDCYLQYKPRSGDALLFWSIHPNGTFDKHALHGGCPVTKGEKWVATKWIRDKCFGCS